MGRLVVFSWNVHPESVAMAERAGLARYLAKSYIRSAYRKMEVTSRSQAVLWGLEHRLQPTQTRPLASVAGGRAA